MALTNRARMSTSCHWVPVFPVGVRPIGQLTQLSRQAAGWMYAGILAGDAAIEPPFAPELTQLIERPRERRVTEFFNDKRFDI